MVKADSLSSMLYPHYATGLFLRPKSELLLQMRVQCMCNACAMCMQPKHIQVAPGGPLGVNCLVC